MVYQLNDEVKPFLSIAWDDGTHQSLAKLVLSAEESSELFRRNGRIRQLTLSLATGQLFSE